MDFASRHAAPAPPPPEAAVAEEPEYLARYLVVKHSGRGRYRRILCVAASGLVTLDPATLAVTNSYDLAADFDRAAPDPNAAEFTLIVRTDGRGSVGGVCVGAGWGSGFNDVHDPDDFGLRIFNE